MKDINQANLSGRLGQDAEPKVYQEQNGGETTVFTFSIASSIGRQGDKPLWTRVSYRSHSPNQTEFLRRQLVKGNEVYVSGSLRSFDRALPGGQRASSLYVQADLLKVLTLVPDGGSQQRPPIDMEGLSPEEQAMAESFDALGDPEPPAAPPPAPMPAARQATAVAPRHRTPPAARPAMGPLRPATGSEVSF